MATATDPRQLPVGKKLQLGRGFTCSSFKDEHPITGSPKPLSFTNGKKTTFVSYLSAEADYVLPKLLGLALIVSSTGLYMHALPPLQRLNHLPKGEVLLRCVARRAVLGLDVVEQRARRAAPLPHLLLEAGRGGRRRGTRRSRGRVAPGLFPCFMTRGGR